MQFITLDDIQDKLLNVTENDIIEANLFVTDKANRMGVELEKISVPATFNVKRLAVCFACYNRCLACVGTDATTSFDNGSRQDIFAQKLEFYKSELKFIEARLTETDFTGVKANGVNIGLWRA